VPVFGRAPDDGASVTRPRAYALVADAAGRLAVVRTGRGWFLPGGGLEAGETPADAAARAARAACGLAVAAGPWSVRAVEHAYAPDERAHVEQRSTFVDAHAGGGAADPATPDAGPAGGEPDRLLAWLTCEQAAARLSHPSHRWAVARWRHRGAGG
jgi:8-oxo-dGTP diphosphatase